MVARAAGAVLLAVVAAAAQGRPPIRLAAPGGEPHVIAARQATLEHNAELRALVDAVHRDTDAIVVLNSAGTAVGPTGLVTGSARQRDLLPMFDALGALAMERRIVVADGGLRAGVMEAVGKVRVARGRGFLLVGIAPARAVAPLGPTPIDPHHSHLVTVDDPAQPRGDAGWGTETATMYWLVNRLSEGRNSVAIISGGGAGTLDEIAANVEYGRPMILIDGSGGAADAMVTLTRGTTPADSEVHLLLQRARAARLTRRPDLFRVVSIDAGAAGLLVALRAELGPVVPRMP